MSAVGRQVRANLTSARRQSVLVALTVVGAAGLLSLALASFGTASDAYERLLERVDGAHLWIELDPVALTASAPDQAAVDEDLHAAVDHARDALAALPGVAAVTDPRATVANRIRVGDRQQWLQLQEWPGDDAPVARVLVVDGAPPLTGVSGQIALDRNLALHLDVEVGDDIEVLGASGWQPVTVVARVVSPVMCPAPLCEPVIAYLPPGGLATLGLDPPPRPDTRTFALGLRLDDPAAHARTLTDAEERLPPGAIRTAWDHEGMAEFSDFTLRITSVFLIAFGLVAAVAAGLLVASAIGEAVRGDTRRIGLLKAVGFTRAQLARVYLAQHLGVALVASLLGVGAGSMVAVRVLGDVAARFGETGRGLPWWAVLVVPCAVLAITALATWRPVRRASGVDALTAIRSGALHTRRRPARLPRIPGVARVPVPLATAVVDLRARPARTAFTAATLGLAALTLSFAVTVLHTLGELREDPSSGLVAPADLGVERPDVLSDIEVRALLEGYDDIAAVRSTRWLQWQQPDGDERFGALVFDGDLEAFEEPLIRGRMFAGAGEVVAGYGLAEHLDLDVGDELTILVVGQPVALEVTGITRELFNMGRMLRMHADSVSAITPDAQADGYELLLRPGTDPAPLKAALDADTDGLVQATTVESFAGPVLDTLPTVMLGLSALLAAIALVGVLNTVWVGVQERTRELGLLVAVGMRGRQVMASVLLGAGATALLGCLVGLPAGVAVTRLLLGLLGRGLGFGPVGASVDGWLLLAVVPVVVAVALLGALVPARRAARLEVVEALRTE